MRLLAFALCALTTLCCAKNFGTRAHTFPIQEEDIAQHMQKQMQANLPDSKKAVEKATNPEPVKGISECTESRTFTYEPEYVATKDIKDHEGNVIVSKGSRYNPLRFMQPTSDLLFIDGTNQKHIAWALKQPKTSKWILVKGKPLDLEVKWQRPVYYDQHGWYARNFNIQHVPSKVSVKDEKILVCEIPLREVS